MEKDFQAELNRGLAASGWWSYKIPDAPTSRFSGVQGSRFTPKKPFDCEWLCNGRFHALELKQTKGLSLALSELRDHQEEELLAVEASGGFGWLVVNFRCRLSATQQRKRGGLEVMDRAFAARIGQVVAARVDEARTGLPLDWWEANAVELPRQKSSGVLSWDPTPIAEAAGLRSRAA